MNYSHIPQPSFGNGASSSMPQYIESLHSTTLAYQLVGGSGDNDESVNGGQNGMPAMLVVASGLDSPDMLLGTAIGGLGEPHAGVSVLDIANFQNEESVQQISEHEFRCMDCDESFRRKSDAVRHSKEQHSNAEPHRCPYCGKTYRRSYNLRKHMVGCTGNPANAGAGN